MDRPPPPPDYNICSQRIKCTDHVSRSRTDRSRASQVFSHARGDLMDVLKTAVTNAKQDSGCGSTAACNAMLFHPNSLYHFVVTLMPCTYTADSNIEVTNRFSASSIWRRRGTAATNDSSSEQSMNGNMVWEFLCDVLHKNPV